MNVFRKHFLKKRCFLIGVNGKYYTHAGVICYTSAGGCTDREVENDSTVGDCRKRAKKPTWFGCLKRNTESTTYYRSDNNSSWSTI